MNQKPIKVLVAKPGLDGHDRGAKVIAQALRDAGMEVVYSGLRQTPEVIVETALQEDVKVIALSCLSGAHMQLFPAVTNGLKKRNITDILVLGGGIIPEEDINELKHQGIAEIFTPGTYTREVITFINERINKRYKS